MKQKMMTKELERKVPSLYATDGQGDDAIVQAHYFSMLNGWDWYMTEYDSESGDAFGYVRGLCGELGYFSIREFERINAQYGFCAIERDTFWTPCALGSVRKVA